MPNRFVPPARAAYLRVSPSAHAWGAAFERSFVAWLLVAICVLTASAAHAQVRADDSNEPRVEFGAQGGLDAFLGNDGAFLPSAGGRVTVNITRLDAVELVADVIPPIDRGGLYSLYFLQYKRVVREGDRQRSAIFMTVGAGGTFHYDRIPEYRQPRADGSIVIHPPYTTAELTRPFLVAGGVGAERVLARYVAFRAEVQMLVGSFASIGVRGVLGVSIPLGGYDDPKR